jgi:hypothetical protein
LLANIYAGSFDIGGLCSVPMSRGFVLLVAMDMYVRVYRRPGERYTAATIQEVDRYGGRSIMVWGGISKDGRTELVMVPQRLNAQIYVETILQEHVMPFANNFGDDFILQQDNSRVHTANLTVNFLQDQEIQVMEWPAMSPDLNRNEHVWDMLHRRIRKRPAAALTLQKLAEKCCSKPPSTVSGCNQYTLYWFDGAASL